MANPLTKARNRKPVFLFFSVFLVSTAAIAYEILLMRLFSIIQWHYFAYMVISLALLGYGVSGTFLAMARTWLRSHVAAAYLCNAVLMGFSMVGCFVIAQQVPFNPLEVVWNRWQLLYLLCFYLLLFIPFFCAANCIGLLFIEYQDRIDQIYLADMLGGGTGAFLILFLFLIQPPEVSLRMLGGIGLLAAALAGLDRSLALPRWPSAILLFLAILFPMTLPKQIVSLRMSEFKGLSQTLQVVDTKVVSKVSGPLAHLTVVESPTIPFRHAPGLSLRSRSGPPTQLGLFTDGDGMSVITQFDGRFEPLSYLDQLTSALPYHLLNHPSVLILGAGGGLGILQALYHEAVSIDAVEINRQVVDLMRGDFSDYSGEIYDASNVQVHVADARSFVIGSDKAYDLIQLSLLESQMTASAGTHAITESYLYTVEGFGDYLTHLKPGGILVLTRWFKLPPRDVLKLLATAIEALGRIGVRTPQHRIALIRSWDTTTLLIKNGDFGSKDLEKLRTFAKVRGFDIAHLPGMSIDEANRFHLLEDPYLFEGAKALLGKDREAFIEQYKFQIQPARDDRPYFSRFFKWRTLPELLSLRGRGGFPLVEWGYLILWGTLAQVAVVSVILVLLPILKLKKNGPTQYRKWRIGFYFVALGLAFLFVEIVFINKFILFLSHPLYAISAVLSSFLVFAGLGSGFSKRHAKFCKMKEWSPILVAVIGIISIASIYIIFLPLIFKGLMSLDNPVKIAVSVFLIAPLAFFMGMPFPLGLSKLGKEAPGLIPWAWGINGCASVLSAILATILAIHFGFTIVILLALLLYFFAALAFRSKLAL